jgi:hypothetical protein
LPDSARATAKSATKSTPASADHRSQRKPYTNSPFVRTGEIVRLPADGSAVVLAAA